MRVAFARNLCTSVRAENDGEGDLKHNNLLFQLCFKLSSTPLSIAMILLKRMVFLFVIRHSDRMKIAMLSESFGRTISKTSKHADKSCCETGWFAPGDRLKFQNEGVQKQLSSRLSSISSLLFGLATQKPNDCSPLPSLNHTTRVFPRRS